MNRPLPHRITVLALAFSTLFLCARPTRATDIMGTISNTMVISDDSELVGDVTCTVTNAPCIAFGASGIKLRLNGFSITGSATDCTASTATDGIDAVRQHDVAILGPGLVQKFAVFGIALIQATKVRVEGVTTTDNCFSGIILIATTDSDIERNLSVRNSMHSGGNPCGGT